MPAFSVAFAGLAMMCVRIGLMLAAGPQAPVGWMQNLLKADWWVLQPSLWLVASERAANTDGRVKELAGRLQEAEKARARTTLKAAAASALSLSAAAAATVEAAAALQALESQRALTAAATAAATAPRQAPAPAVVGRRQGERVATQAAMLTSVALGSVAGLAAFWATRRPQRFHDHVQVERAPRGLRRIVRVQCPGVSRSDVVISVPPRLNGAEISISRRAAPGLEAVNWRKAYGFPWSEGAVACRQEELQLEQGVLTLVFDSSQQQQGRVIRMPRGPVLAYDMAAGDEVTPRLPCSSKKLPSDGVQTPKPRMQLAA